MAAFNFREIMTRILTALVLIPVVLAFFYLGGVWLSVFIILFMLGAFYEYCFLLGLDVNSFLSSFVFLIISLVILLFLKKFFIEFEVGLASLYIAFFLYRWKKGFAFSEFAKEFFGIVYFTAGGFSIFLMRESLGFVNVVVFLSAIWIFDTGGYIFGKSMGKHKLAYKASPNKTVEGLVGGSVILYVIYLLYFKFLMHTGHNLFVHALLLTLIISFGATVGDLIESIWKREKGVKDSSNIFPGHGGVLDRIDSIVFTAPLYLIYFFLT